MTAVKMGPDSQEKWITNGLHYNFLENNIDTVKKNL